LFGLQDPPKLFFSEFSRLVATKSELMNTPELSFYLDMNTEPEQSPPRTLDSKIKEMLKKIRKKEATKQ
jgi:hypothetical protein